MDRGVSKRYSLRGNRIAILVGLLASFPTTQPSPRPVWTRILATIVFFAAFEGILFHTGLYSSIVEPDSTTGYMELQLATRSGGQTESQPGAGGGTLADVALAARGE